MMMKMVITIVIRNDGDNEDGDDDSCVGDNGVCLVYDPNRCRAINSLVVK